MSSERKEIGMERTEKRKRRSAVREGTSPHPGHLTPFGANRRQFSPQQHAKGYSPASWKKFNP